MSEASSIVGATAGDQALRPFGVVRLAVPVPFTEAGGIVNVYLIDEPDGGLTLFDAGISTDACREALLAGFAAAGRRIEEVRRIIISHGHLDHYGGARFIAERAGARVVTHPRDAGKVVADAGRPRDHAAYGPYFARLGVPLDAIFGMAAIYRGQLKLAERVAAAEPLEAGTRLQLRGFEAEVLHMPGHTPGHICLHAPAARAVFTADHLLARISPNPLLELGPGGEDDKFRALCAYLDSVRRLRALDLDWLLPGHGAPFQDHRPIVDRLLRFYDVRQAKITRALAAAPRTPYELVLDVFNRAGHGELFLMLSEIIGNLEVLEERGAVARLPGEVPYRYRALTS
ncbi:MAG TPA: MBL fold metallo-hydrolase [Polyangia bacterium]